MSERHEALLDVHQIAEIALQTSPNAKAVDAINAGVAIADAAARKVVRYLDTIKAQFSIREVVIIQPEDWQALKAAVGGGLTGGDKWKLIIRRGITSWRVSCVAGRTGH